MQEQSLISILLFLIAQTIAIWKKLEKLEAKIDKLTNENKRQDSDLEKIKSKLETIQKHQTEAMKG